MLTDYKIINGNSLEVLDTLEENSVSSIVTDPPYELGFMGKAWDASGIAYNVDLWKKALRVLKPGGYLLAFGGTRTYHRICCAIEDAGFEIRDCIMWLYGSGFPKSMSIGKVVESKLVLGSANVKDIKRLDGTKTSITGGWVGNELEQGKRQENYEQTKTIVNYTTEEGKKWDGWGTALKPAYEPIIVAKKPVEDTIVNNVLKYGVGGINIDGCRVGDEELHNAYAANKTGFTSGDTRTGKALGMFANQKEGETVVNGRFPANVILTYDETDYNEVCGGMPETKSTGGSGETSQINTFSNVKIGVNGKNTDAHLGRLGDEGSAARYFYCAKASSKDRDEGLDDFEVKTKVFNGKSDKSSTDIKDVEERFTTELRNIHPTVKPTELMQYLVRLVTPKGGTVLDIFNGSGSTGKAVAFENRERNADYKYIGIELDPEYCKISEARIDYAANKYKYDVIAEVKENEKKGQLSLFDFSEEDQ